MFEIGQTSGVTTCKKDPCKSICSYLSKMAKTAEDLPCPHVAATKVVEVAQGTFCKGEVLKSAIYSADSGGGGSGCCGGSSCSGSGGCCGKSCGGTSAPSSAASQNKLNITGAGTTNSGTSAAYTRDQETADAIIFSVEHSLDIMQLLKKGIQYVRDPMQALREWQRPITNTARTLSPSLVVPRTIDDILNSSYSTAIENQNLVATEFRRSMCQRRPFPECDACPYAYTNMTVDDSSLLDILRGIQQGLEAIARGDCTWGENMFNCPGQIRAMLEQSLGPLGRILGPVAAGTMIALTAAKGALHAHTNILRTYKHTDSAIQLKKSVGRAIASGGCPSSYVTMANEILKELDVETADLFTSGSMPWIGTGLISRGSDRSNVPGHITASTSAGPKTRSDSKSKVPSSIADKSTSLQNSTTPIQAELSTGSSPFTPDPTQTNYRASYGSHSNSIRARLSSTPQGPSTFAKRQAKNVSQSVDTPVKVAEKLMNDPHKMLENKEVRPLKRSQIVYPTSQTRAELGKSYYYEEKTTDPTTGAVTKKMIPINTKTNENLQPYRAKYGIIYSKPFSRQKVSETNYPSEIKTYVSTEDTVGQTGKTYWKLEAPTTVGSDIRVPVAITNPTEVAAIEGRFISSAEASLGYKIMDEVVKNGYSHDEPPIFIREDGEVVSTRPVVFENGLMLEPTVSVDSVDLDVVVDTTKLVTKTHIMASEMAKLYGIGLTEDELRMAYLLDHENNGSVMPDDCRCATRVKTILDTLPDDEYE